MKKMKICIVSREYPPETLWGGIGTFTYNLAHGLNAIGHDVDVISFTFGDEVAQDDEGITIHRIRSPKIPFTSKTWWDLVARALFPFSLFYSYKVMQKIESLYKKRHYDVIDFPEHIGEGFFSVLFNCWPSLVRLYTPLSLIGEMGLRKSTNSLDYYLFGLLEKYSIKHATIVNSPSRNLAKLVAYKFKYKGDVSIIYNPIDTNKFAPAKDQHKSDTEVVRVLFAGRLEDRKGAHVLAHAIPKVVNEVKNVQFTFLGKNCRGVNGFMSMKSYIKSVLSKGGGLENVQFEDPVPYDLLANNYQSADIMVVPSLFDNSPYTCLEAMSCGLPVIGTSAGGMPEYIDDGVCGTIVPPDDHEALSRAIIDLVKDSEKRQTYGRAARDKTISVFKREVVAAEITELYLQASKKFST